MHVTPRFRGVLVQVPMPLTRRTLLGNALLGAVAPSISQARLRRRTVQVFGTVNAHFTRGTSYCWDTDEYSRGGHAYFAPGQFLSAFPRIRQPEGRVHFAGEHTSAWFGMMNGAVESGLRAASEFLARV